MNVEEIKAMLPKDYRKQASRDLTLFTSSIFGETYSVAFRELFGIDFPSILWVVRKGNFMTFYRSDGDHENLRKQLGEKELDKDFADEVVRKLTWYTDWFNAFIPEHDSLEKFLPRKAEFVKNYRDFFAYHQAVYWGGDYLLETHPELKETLKALQDVYAYNERVVPDVEKYLCDLGIGHLTYQQTEGDFREVGLFFFQDKETVSVYGEELNEVENYIKDLGKVNTDLKELKGLCVSKGNVRGKVQVIKDPNKLDEAKAENIIVTGMTRPQFNPVLAKCRGLITNEGNVLSHAAILSRETGIPCIVRTKIATEVLKDGDEVEVDAEKGIVRVLD